VAVVVVVVVVVVVIVVVAVAECGRLIELYDFSAELQTQL